MSVRLEISFHWGTKSGFHLDDSITSSEKLFNCDKIKLNGEVIENILIGAKQRLL